MTWGIIFIIILNFSIILVDSYVQSKNLFTSQTTRLIQESVTLLNTEALKDSYGVISYNDDDSTFCIIRNDTKYVSKYNTTKKLNANIFRAAYDIRNSEHWNLNRLAAIIEEKIAIFPHPILLIRTDSSGEQIDRCKSNMGNFELQDLNLVHITPLGFLEKHQLKWQYTYPWRNFWTAEGMQLSVIFLSLTLIITFAWLFLKRIRDTERKAENQALFVQSLNHDLRSPQAYIRIKMHQIRKCSPVSYTSQQEKLFEHTDRKIGEILNAIDRLAHDSIDSNQIHLNLQMINLKKLIEEQIAEAIQENKKVEIEMSSCPHDLAIYADKHHLARVFQNLIENAVKYSNDNVHIRINCYKKTPFIQIEIEDNGWGIPKSELKHIFEKNYRSRSIHKEKKVKGFGLGLYYVKMIICAHRGTVRIESESGKGTTFYIRLKYGKKN